MSLWHKLRRLFVSRPQAMLPASSASVAARRFSEEERQAAARYRAVASLGLLAAALRPRPLWSALRAAAPGNEVPGARTTWPAPLVRRARREGHGVELSFLGHGVSSRLGDMRTDREALAHAGLPVLASPAEVAQRLGLGARELRRLCFHADVATYTHYTRFEVAKRSGGVRVLASPHRRLAQAQRWVLEHVLARLAPTEHAHGFVRGRSTVTNAQQHLGQHVVAKLDLRDFFPTITFPRVRGLFQSLGYSPAAATVLALLCTEAPRVALPFDGRTYWVATGARALPQGACTSPALSNLITRKLDRRLAGLASALGWTYTRYADDLTFSAGPLAAYKLGALLGRARDIIASEGFAVAEHKGSVLRSSRRQAVTGVVVNAKPGVPRHEVRRLRAILHAAARTGLEAQNREGHPDFAAHLLGKISYVAMVDPTKGAALRAAYDRLLDVRYPDD